MILQTSTQRVEQQGGRTAYFIYFLAASFYLYEFILQVAPSVMAKPMQTTFQISAEGFGVISAFYFYAYAPMQLPAGLLFDRYGPRKLMTGALVLCALGSFFFASTDSIFTAAMGRFMIGVGSAFSFIGVLVLISRWFPPKHFAVLAGVAQLMSSIGAISGEMPLAKLVDCVGWREASFILSGIGLILAGFLWLFIRDYPGQLTQSPPARPLREECKRLVEICKQPHTWITGGYAFSIWTPIAVFAALWGVPYLEEKYEVSVVVASGLCSMIWIGIGIGSPLLGWFSDYRKSRRLALGIGAALGFLATLVLLYVPDVPIGWMSVVLLILGLGAGGQAVSFAVVKDNSPEHLVGTASGFNNLCVLVGGAIFQPLVGVVLHRTGTWHLVNEIQMYTVDSYQKALLIMPFCHLIALLIVLFIMKESYPRSHTGKLSDKQALLH